MHKILSLILFSLLSTFLGAEDIVIDAEKSGYINPHWQLVSKDLIVYKNKPWIKLDTQGNCHYEYEQQCTPLPNGGMNCTMVPKWVCDTNSTLYSLPETVKVLDKEVRYQNSDKDIKIGTMKSFLWFKWVSLEKYVGIWTDREAAKLILRDQAIVEKELRFNELYNEGLPKE